MPNKIIKKVQAIIYDLPCEIPRLAGSRLGRISHGRPYFLILHRVLRWRGWEFLKGTLKKGETPKQAIKREKKEETKLKNFRIIKSLHQKEKWEIGGKKYVIADVFLIKADMNEKLSLKQRKIEHNKYLWADKKTVLKKLTWPKTKEFLKEIKLKNLL